MPPLSQYLQVPGAPTIGVSLREVYAFNPGPALWTPALFPNVVALWDAAAGITLDGSNNVSAWTDSVGGVPASQATAANRPGYSATARNGAPGLLFTAANSQNLSFIPSGLPAVDAVSFIFISAYITGATSTNETAFVYGKLGFLNARSIGVRSGIGCSTDAQNVYSSGQSADTIDFCLASTFGAGSSAINVNGGAVTTGSPPTQNTRVADTGSTGIIGSYISGSEYISGVFKTILVGSSAPSTANRQKLEGWDSWKKGMAGANLAAGHPFKSRAPLTTD